MKRQRGMLTDEINKIAFNFLGRELNQKELRLYPYLSYISPNNSELDLSKVNNDELEILDNLESEGHLKRLGRRIVFTKEFYLFMHEIIYLSYVPLIKEENEELWNTI